MTTNVYDVSSGLLTSDSRWSTEDGDWIAYVDDTGYDKIVFDEALALIFAGDMQTIDIWKEWFLNGDDGDEPLDKVDDISIIGIDMKTGEQVYMSDYLLYSHSHRGVEAIYGGSGAPYAKDCWQENKCAMQATKTAIIKDVYSGGTTAHVNRQTSDSNVKNSASSNSAYEQLKERGMMINKTENRQPVYVKDAANDPSHPAQKIAEKVMSGKAALKAPFPGMDQPWTNEKKQELKEVLKRYPRKK
jgi:hypothetical protein